VRRPVGCRWWYRYPVWRAGSGWGQLVKCRACVASPVFIASSSASRPPKRASAAPGKRGASLSSRNPPRGLGSRRRPASRRATSPVRPRFSLRNSGRGGWSPSRRLRFGQNPRVRSQPTRDKPAGLRPPGDVPPGGPFTEEDHGQPMSPGYVSTGLEIPIVRHGRHSVFLVVRHIRDDRLGRQE